MILSSGRRAPEVGLQLLTDILTWVPEVFVARRSNATAYLQLQRLESFTTLSAYCRLPSQGYQVVNTFIIQPFNNYGVWDFGTLTLTSFRVWDLVHRRLPLSDTDR